MVIAVAPICPRMDLPKFEVRLSPGGPLRKAKQQSKEPVGRSMSHAIIDKRKLLTVCNYASFPIAMALLAYTKNLSSFTRYSLHVD